MFEQLRKEAAAAGDIVMLPDVWEGYHNITHQTLEVCRAAALHPQATHTMKVPLCPPCSQHDLYTCGGKNRGGRCCVFCLATCSMQALLGLQFVNALMDIVPLVVCVHRAM